MGRKRMHQEKFCVRERAKATFLFRKALTYMKGFEIQTQSNLGLCIWGETMGETKIWCLLILLLKWSWLWSWLNINCILQRLGSAFLVFWQAWLKVQLLLSSVHNFYVKKKLKTPNLTSFKSKISKIPIDLKLKLS